MGSRRPRKTQSKSKQVVSQRHGSPYRRLFYLVLVLTFLVYVRILGHQYVNFDDDWYIYTNAYVAGFTWDKLVELLTQPHYTQYSPLPQLYLALLFELGGGEPFLMKLFALLTHILNTFLVFRLIQKLTRDDRGAFFVAALFALHPLQVESVAWLTAIFKISACFSLVAMLLYLKFLETRRIIYYAGIVILFGLSFITKEQAVLLPVSLVLIDYLLGRGLLSRRVIIEKVPLFLMSLVFGLLTIKIATGASDAPVDNTLAVQKIYLMSVAIGHYVQKLLIPVGLSILYVKPVFTAGLEPQHIALPLTVLAGLGLGWFVSRKDRVGLFGLLFWIANLSLSLSFVLLHLRDTIVADRYMYLASVGFFLALYALLSRWVEARPGSKRVVQVLVLAYVVALTWATYMRTAVFSNAETLWADALRQNPANHHAYAFRGRFYHRNGDYVKAITDYQSSIRLDPHSHVTQLSLGLAYYQTGQMDKALLHTSTAIEEYAVARRSPEGEARYLDAFSNRAIIYMSTNESEKALADLELVLDKEPGRMDALQNRSLTYYDLGRYQECLYDLERLLKHDPNTAWNLDLAGLCHSRLGDPRSAIAFFDRAIASDPRQGAFWLNRSRAYHRLQDKTSALADALQAQKLGAKVDPAYLSGLGD